MRVVIDDKTNVNVGILILNILLLMGSTYTMSFGSRKNPSEVSIFLFVKSSLNVWVPSFDGRKTKTFFLSPCSVISPAIASAQVIVGSVGGVLYGTNQETGRLNWSYKLGDGYIFSSPAIWDNFVVIGSCDGNVYKIQIP